MRLASAISGFACAMQRHAAARPYVPSAILDGVSPWRAVTFRSDCKRVSLEGTTISVRAAMRVGSAMPGLAASSSGQREPRPRFCCATFQRESPGCRVTVCRGEGVFVTAGGVAIEMAGRVFGADGAITGAVACGWAEGAIGGAAFGCRAGGAIRAAAGGEGGAKRGVKGSTRRRGAVPGIAGATTALRRAGATFGCTGENLGRGGATSGTEIT